MKIDDQLFDRIANLASLEFEEAERKELMDDMNKMVSFIDTLDELDTENTSPLKYITEEEDILRDDTPSTKITQEEALKNAPKKDSDYFKVPRVIERDQ